MTCHRTGLPPISTSGFGKVSPPSRMRVPLPPHRIATTGSTGGRLLAGARSVVRYARQTGARRVDLRQRLCSGPMRPAPFRARSYALSLWLAFKRLTQLGFPRRFPIVQFPNLPLIVAFLAGVAGRFVHGTAHSYTQSLAYLGVTIWAYEELAHGVNWFRRLLGL